MAIYRCVDCGAEMTMASEAKSHAKRTGHGKGFGTYSGYARFEVQLRI